MKIDPTVTERIRERLTRHPQSGMLRQLAEADLDNLASAAAADVFRVSRARWMPVCSLVWNMDNLRPEIQKRLEDELVKKALSRCSRQNITSRPPAGVDSMAGHPETVPSKTLPPEPEMPMEKTAPKRDSPNPVPRREDWFDGFLSFLGNLLP